jgi:hypothetical protein
MINQSVIIWGGWGEGKRTDGAVFDLEKRTWSLLPNAPIEFTYGMVGTSWGEKFIVGGGTDSRQLAAFDLKAQTWENFSESPFAIGEYPAIVASDTEVFLWSGHKSTDSLRTDGLRFDFAKKKWSVAPPAPIEARWCSEGRCLDGRFVVFGGWLSDPERFVRTAAIFEPNRQKWTSIAEIPGDVPRHVHPGW